jgi:hypothetical protein
VRQQHGQPGSARPADVPLSLSGTAIHTQAPSLFHSRHCGSQFLLTLSGGACAGHSHAFAPLPAPPLLPPAVSPLCYLESLLPQAHAHA